MLPQNRPAVRVGTTSRDALGGGVPCPTCGTLIPIAVQGLLRLERFRCPAPRCGTTLRLDAGRSGAALTALREYQKRPHEVHSLV
jgi:hypothetical protein